MFESDVPRETRVLTDLYLEEDNPSKGHTVMFFDIEVSMENGIPNIENPNNEVTAVTLYDSATKEYTVLVLDKTGSRENYKKGDIDTYFFRDELISSTSLLMSMKLFTQLLLLVGIVITSTCHISTID
jgi:DNA polymerase elongation subunit (family B)